MVFAGCLWVWWKACSTDPGTVTEENVEDLCQIYEFDDQIFTSSQCKTCDLVKPARSKHCSLCNVCVAVMVDIHEAVAEAEEVAIVVAEAAVIPDVIKKIS